MGSLYSEHRTWLHAVPAGWKLGLLVLLSALIFSLRAPTWLALACLGSGVVYASLGRARATARVMRNALLWAALLLLALHAALGQPWVGVGSVLRMVATSLLGIALTLTTRSADLQAVLEWLLQPLRPVGVRPERVALQLALMLRFIEHFFVLWNRLDESHRLRTGRPGGWRLLAPLTIQMLQTAERVADTLHVRLGE